jgi:hypothetical protein
MCDHEFFGEFISRFFLNFFSVSYCFYISRARLNVGNREEKRRKGNGSVPPVSLPSCIWLYKHQPSSPVPRNIAIKLFLFIIYLHVYGCGCAAICGAICGEG